MFKAQAVFKIMLLLFIFISLSTPLECAQIPSVITSFDNSQTNQWMGGHVYQHINCSQKGKTSFIDWNQMKRRRRFIPYTCQCVHLKTACFLPFDQYGRDDNCKPQKFPNVKYVFDQVWAQDGTFNWILLSAHPERKKIKSDLQEEVDIQDFTGLESIQTDQQEQIQAVEEGQADQSL